MHPFTLHDGTPACLDITRNGAGTVTVTLAIHGQSDVEAKSQGPTAGGYCKRTQAIERLAAKLGRSDLARSVACQSPERFIAAYTRPERA